MAGVTRLVRRARRVLTFERFAVLVVFATIGLGFYGFERWRDVAQAGGTAADSFYRALQLFTLGFDLPDAKAEPAPGLPFSLQAARFLAAASLVYAVIRLGWSHLLIQFRLRLQAWLRAGNRHVLLGHGDLNSAIAAELVRRRSGAVTIVAQGFDRAERIFAREHGLLLITADLRDEDSLRPLRLHRSRSIIVACGDDTLNLAVATSAATLIASTGPLPDNRGQVHAHLASVRMEEALARSRDHGFGQARRVECFSLKTLAAQVMLTDVFPAEVALRHGQRRVHLVLFGFGDQGEAVVRQMLTDGCAVGLEPPEITVFCEDARQARDRFTAACPALFDATLPAADQPVLRFLQANVEDVDFKRPIQGDQIGAKADLPVNLEDLSPPTFWVFACGHHDLNLRMGRLLEDAMQRGFRAARPIRVAHAAASLRPQGAGSRHGYPSLGVEISGQLQTFGAVQETVRNLPLLERDPDWLAREIHARYQLLLAERLPGWGVLPFLAFRPDATDPVARRSYAEMLAAYRASWAFLSNEFREANRRLAHHAPVALFGIGLDWQGRHIGKLPDLSRLPGEIGDRFLRGFSDHGTDDGAFVLAVAYHEHRRWMIDRALKGWGAVTGDEPQRNNTRRIHTDIQAFEDLGGGRQTQLLNAGLVLALADILSARGPLAVMGGMGVKRESHVLKGLEAADEQSVIAPAASALILRLEPPAGTAAEAWLLDRAMVARLGEQILSWARKPEACRIEVVLGSALPAYREFPLQPDRIGPQQALELVGTSLRLAWQGKPQGPRLVVISDLVPSLRKPVDARAGEDARARAR